MRHPLRGRVFGGAIDARARPAKRAIALPIYALTRFKTTESWRQELDQSSNNRTRRSPEQARRDHERWWDDFWQRSSIDVPRRSR
jgi:hypothetical protein